MVGLLGTILAVDDGYFLPEYKSLKGYTPVVGVTGYRSIIYSISLRMLLVDSMDIESLIVEIYRESVGDIERDLNAIVCDNVIYGGFSTYDPWSLQSTLGKPVIVVFSHPLDLRRIRSALERHFSDHLKRYDMIERSYRSSRVIATPRGHLRILCVGLRWGECAKLIIDNQTYHPLPQPLRHADIIASAVGKTLALGSPPTKAQLDKEHYE